MVFRMPISIEGAGGGWLAWLDLLGKKKKKKNGISHVLHIGLDVVGDDFHGGTVRIHLVLPVL